jgi:DNA-directed RNA polymerase subunit M/transcription elongation factor TFIIS
VEKKMDLDSFIPNHPTRLKIYNALNKLLQDVCSHNDYKDVVSPDVSVQKMALNLERGIFNYTLDSISKAQLDGTWNDAFGAMYKMRAVTIYSNLNPFGYLKNVNLVRRLLIREVDEFMLCKFDSSQLFPEKYNENMERYKKEVGQEVYSIPLEDRPDGILQCRKCKSWKTTYSERQTRSADEPTTKFCACFACGNRWRFC